MFVKYLNFADIFFSNFIIEVPKHININKYFIDLIKS